MSIPKIIHYCWLSDEKIPPLIRTCLDSWKRYLPDYEFKLWNKDSLDLNKYPFAKEAYEAKKYAFATDFIRLYALYHEGGIYLDCDLLLKKNIDDFLSNDFFSFVECSYFKTGEPMGKCQMQAAFIGSVSHHPFIAKLFELYKDKHFLNPNGTYNMKVLPVILAEQAESLGFKDKDRDQQLEGMHIYSSKLCAPNTKADKENAVAVHFCDHSWKKKNFFSQLSKDFRNYIRTLRLRF